VNRVLLYCKAFRKYIRSETVPNNNIRLQKPLRIIIDSVQNVIEKSLVNNVTVAGSKNAESINIHAQ